MASIRRHRVLIIIITIIGDAKEGDLDASKENACSDQHKVAWKQSMKVFDIRPLSSLVVDSVSKMSVSNVLSRLVQVESVREFCSVRLE